jgi:hypothetical protein
MKLIFYSLKLTIRFLRRRKQDERRITAPYTFLGPATLDPGRSQLDA